ncbi:MAG: tetratricopeptide repeat protein [Deltaproteobacteria bacterium]|nr:tetratricopeptide repeat protein [Deltaproteobacteria bacterium]
MRQAGGGTSYGEVNLDGGGADSAVGVADDDMEFGAIPQESEGAPPGAASAAATGLPAAAPFATVPVARVAQRKQSGRGLRIGLGLLVLVAVGGGALSMVPSAGPYGAYFIADRLNAGRNAQMVSDTVAKVRTLRGLDTSASADEALALVERQRGEAKRVKALAAYAAFLGYEREIRFGGQPAVAGRAKVLLDELAQQKPSEVRYLALARAAQSAYAGQLARARQELEALAASDPRDVDVRVLDGEVGLRAQEPKAALSAWQAAQSLVDDARTRFGLARAELALGDATSAAKDAEAALAKSPKHIGARILLARAAWLARGDEAGATKLLSEATAPGSEASADEQVAAKTLLGTINLARSRFTQAEAAFTDALKIDPKAAGALAGLGESLYRSGRFSEALARYEAAVQADPEAIEAKLGVAKAKIALERLDDAKELLKKLREDYPKSTGVSYWYGEALEALGQRKEAEDAYRAAIEMGGTNVSVVEPYVALALLLGQQGRSDEAKAVLDEARKKLPDLPQIHKAVGELALSQGRYDEALAQYRAALALDPTDVGAKFRLGVALRRDRQFDAATKVFDEVAGVDRDYPGLALERGLLFEASGRSDEALKSYEAALAKAPSDPDLMLRVGCGKVAAGRAKEAEELLRKVLQQRPNSAETNHCLGRALLVEGTNLAEALRSLERATDLDPNRAEYWLYVGWAANDAGRVQRAETALKKALELDQGLADAYWQRGVLRFRQGSTKEAIADLLKALELRPSRYEAHATLADAYYDMGQEGKAMDEWQQAIAAQGDNATWRFRYGKLLAVNRRAAEAEEQLTKAVELGDAQEVKPDWLPEAHLQLARVMGAKKEAIRHWEAFLRDGPRDSPYRAEAKAALVKLGRPWTEN